MAISRAPCEIAHAKSYVIAPPVPLQSFSLLLPIKKPIYRGLTFSPTTGSTFAAKIVDP